MMDRPSNYSDPNENQNCEANSLHSFDSHSDLNSWMVYPSLLLLSFVIFSLWHRDFNSTISLQFGRCNIAPTDALACSLFRGFAEVDIQATGCGFGIDGFDRIQDSGLSSPEGKVAQPFDESGGYGRAAY